LRQPKLVLHKFCHKTWLARARHNALSEVLHDREVTTKQRDQFFGICVSDSSIDVYGSANLAAVLRTMRPHLCSASRIVKSGVSCYASHVVCLRQVRAGSDLTFASYYLLIEARSMRASFVELER
jgi:hypothetical protein